MINRFYYSEQTAKVLDDLSKELSISYDVSLQLYYEYMLNHTRPVTSSDFNQLKSKLREHFVCKLKSK